MRALLVVLLIVVAVIEPLAVTGVSIGEVSSSNLLMPTKFESPNLMIGAFFVCYKPFIIIIQSALSYIVKLK